ncbi:MAG: hypothetical protein C5B43_00780 [Verrucomicrobia bacterium]|nr:MAG: hypothetical protein C5B43_00780 [Verrucomicrobiota bacterium]
MISTNTGTVVLGQDNVSSVQTKLKLGEIDASMRIPVIFFISTALIWLGLGTLFALIASISLHDPEFFPNWEWLTFGRARSAHLNIVAFGWGNNVVFGVAMWLMVRLCQTKLRYPWLLITAGIFWNIAVIVGVMGILLGQLTSVEWLEMPKYVSPILGASYLMIGIWGIVSFIYRETEHVYVSQWYLLGALFWFPWLYIAAETMLLWFPARGTVQSITNWWFGHNVLGLWFTPVAVGAAYYLIPKVLGRPIYSYYLSALGFWTLALFYNWAGVHHLIGGPIPVWLISSGIVASVMMVIPVVVTAINHHLTVVGFFGHVWRSPTLRFVVFGAMSYTLASFIGSAMALREVNLVTHFTHFTVGHAHHGLYAFFTMIMFGSIYYIMPRMLKREWPSALLISLHFWFVGIGITIYVLALSIGGWIQGLQMNNSHIIFIDTMKNTIPYLISRSVGGSMMALGHLFFFIHFVWMFKSKRTTGGPTMFKPLEEKVES